ncbi:transposase [Corynebacterium diphtheriae]|nr:transposase [Corynebacterium diphtheriae]CAB0524309.1 transposase [Corynebacterium diphtheriae]CAB0524625.1 transposase [Corynebacterium diphtheriae]CAB0665363.1 transposase [Corynebacterium diphtheriae]
MAYNFVIGMDVGKYFHHACVLDPQGRQVLSKRINQHEGSLRKLLGKFLANDAEVLVVVDQPNNIGRLTVAVAQAMGADVRYLPGLAMRQLSRIHVGNSKTDVRDAYVIAHAGLNLPDALRSVDRVEDVFLQLKVPNGIDENLARAYTDLGFPVVIACVDDGVAVSLGSACRDSLSAAAVAALNEAWAFYPERQRVRSAGSAVPEHIRSVLDHANQVSLPEWTTPIDRLLGADQPPRRCSKAEDSVTPSALAALIDAGFDPIRINTTLAEVQEYGLTAVTVVVPGLVPIDFGWDRQRAQFMERPAQLCSQATGGIINPLETTCHPFA